MGIRRGEGGEHEEDKSRSIMTRMAEHEGERMRKRWTRKAEKYRMGRRSGIY